jgi:hypothetical protein
MELEAEAFILNNAICIAKINIREKRRSNI